MRWQRRVLTVLVDHAVGVVVFIVAVLVVAAVGMVFSALSTLRVFR